MRIRDSDLRQGTEAWLQWRTAGVGGSEIYNLACYADVLAKAWGKPELARLKPTGEAPAWVITPAVYARRKLGLDPGPVENFHMRRGHRLEPVARAAAERRYGMRFSPFCLCADNSPAMRVSLDGFNDDAGTLIEIKAPYHGWTAIPDYLEYQTAYQAETLRHEAGNSQAVRRVIGLTVREEQRTVEVRAWAPVRWQDLDFCAGLAELACEFYRRHIEERQPVPRVPGVDPVVAFSPGPRGQETRIARLAQRFDAAAHAWHDAMDRLTQDKAAMAAAQASLEELALQLAPGQPISRGGVLFVPGVRHGAISYSDVTGELLDLLWRNGVEVDIEALKEKYRGKDTPAVSVKLSPEATGPLPQAELSPSGSADEDIGDAGQ